MSALLCTCLHSPLLPLVEPGDWRPCTLLCLSSFGEKGAPRAWRWRAQESTHRQLAPLFTDSLLFLTPTWLMGEGAKGCSSPSSSPVAGKHATACSYGDFEAAQVGFMSEVLYFCSAAYCCALIVLHLSLSQLWEARLFFFVYIPVGKMLDKLLGINCPSSSTSFQAQSTLLTWRRAFCSRNLFHISSKQGSSRGCGIMVTSPFGCAMLEHLVRSLAGASALMGLPNTGVIIVAAVHPFLSPAAEFIRDGAGGEGRTAAVLMDSRATQKQNPCFSHTS